MREIKFRAWHKEAKEMLYGDNVSTFRWEEHEHQPVEIMQFTGLKDKNGKEIFELDILKFIGGTCSFISCGNYSHQTYSIGAVLFVKNLLSGWSLQPLTMIDCDIPNRVGKVNNYDLWNHQRSFEIIGNIYENPELITNK